MKLIGLLWSDSGSQHARNNLRQVLFGLRRDLASHPWLLRADGEQLTLDETQLAVDYLALTKAIASNNQDEWHRAVSSYSGSFLEGLTLADNGFEDWVRDTRELAFNLVVELHERLIPRESGMPCVRRARQLVALDPLRETSQRLLIEALAQSAQIDLARKQYQSYAELLKRELDATPSDELTKLMSTFDRRKTAELNPPKSVAVSTTLRPNPRSNGTLFSIAVLPFESCGGGSALGHLAEGIAEDLSTELSRHPRLAVIPQNCLHKAMNGSAELARQRADFAIGGSIRLVGDYIRITARLLDCTTGINVWSERYERSIDEGFAVQDSIVPAIVSSLSFNLSDIALIMRRRDPAKCGKGELLLLEASSMWWRSGRESPARRCLEQAITDDPHNPYAQSLLSFLYSYSAFSNSIELDDAEVEQRSTDLIVRAIDTGAHDADVLSTIAATHMLKGNMFEAVTYAEASTKLMPYDLTMLHTLGVAKLFQGQHEEGLALIKKAMSFELNEVPTGPKMGLTDAYYMIGDYASAVRVYDTILNMPPYVRVLRAASLAQMGRVAEAKTDVAQARSAGPKIFEAKRLARKMASLCAQKEDAEHWIEGFRKAGVDFR